VCNAERSTDDEYLVSHFGLVGITELYCDCVVRYALQLQQRHIGYGIGRDDECTNAHVARKLDHDCIRGLHDVSSRDNFAPFNEHAGADAANTGRLAIGFARHAAFVRMYDDDSVIDTLEHLRQRVRERGGRERAQQQYGRNDQ
jgi:hypothetical protein